MSDSLVLAMASHVLLIACLYSGLTIARAPEVWGIGKTYEGVLRRLEPKISANLSNQFEWPVLFYVVCLLAALDAEPPSTMFLSLAWIFVFGRVLHSAVHIFTGNIRLRGLSFMANFLAVLGMWALLLVQMQYDLW